MRLLVTTSCACVFLLAGAAAGVEYVSTFDITQADFELSGFSSGGPPGEPTAGPDYLDISNIIGTYDLDIPPEGGLWQITVAGFADFDFDQDGETDVSLVVDPTDIGEYPSSGPQTSWGPGEVALPEMTFEYPPFELTLHDLLLGFEADLDGPYPAGPFGPNAFANFTLSNDEGGNLYDLNVLLTMMDNDQGGGDGIVNGWVSGQFTITAVPEPAMLGLLALGCMALWRWRRV